MRQAILSRQQTESWYWQECLQLIDYAKAAIEHITVEGMEKSEDRILLRRMVFICDTDLLYNGNV